MEYVYTCAHVRVRTCIPHYLCVHVGCATCQQLAVLLISQFLCTRTWTCSLLLSHDACSAQHYAFTWELVLIHVHVYTMARDNGHPGEWVWEVDVPPLAIVPSTCIALWFSCAFFANGRNILGPSPYKSRWMMYMYMYTVYTMYLYMYMTVCNTWCVSIFLSAFVKNPLEKVRHIHVHVHACVHVYSLSDFAWALEKFNFTSNLKNANTIGVIAAFPFWWYECEAFPVTCTKFFVVSGIDILSLCDIQPTFDC